MDFVKKLINARKHTDTGMVQRAIYILGKLKSTKAVQPLSELFKQTDNTLLNIEILDSLEEIGAREAKNLIIKLFIQT